MRIFCLVLIALTAVACVNESAKKWPLKQVAAIPKQIKPDASVKYKDADYPVNDSLNPVRILTQGTFHDDEVRKHDSKLNWMGLFKGESGYYLAPSKIKISRVRDEMTDDEQGPKTGWEVKTGKKDSSILLMANIVFLTSRLITPLISPDTLLLPGDTLHINLKGIVYKLYATGKLRADKSIQGKYEIFMDARINNTSYHQLIEAKHQPEGESTIYFIGDIDGDGIPDLIMETANHENIEAPTLYLSKPAVKGQLLKLMGMHVTVGC